MKWQHDNVRHSCCKMRSGFAFTILQLVSQPCHAGRPISEISCCAAAIKLGASASGLRSERLAELLFPRRLVSFVTGIAFPGNLNKIPSSVLFPSLLLKAEQTVKLWQLQPVF